MRGKPKQLGCDGPYPIFLSDQKFLADLRGRKVQRAVSQWNQPGNRRDQVLPSGETPTGLGGCSSNSSVAVCHHGSVTAR